MAKSREPKHSDVKEDKALIKKMVAPAAMKRASAGKKKAKGKKKKE